MQSLGIIDCPVEAQLLPVLVKMKKFFAKFLAILVWKPVPVLSSWQCKTMMMHFFVCLKIQ